MKPSQVRLGSISDFDQLYSIYMDPSINGFLNFEVQSKEEFRPLFNEMMQAGKLYVYVLASQIMATCIVIKHKRRASHVATIKTLAVHPQFQGQGIGRKFMQKLINQLKKEGVIRLDLCAEVDNLKALAFYQKLGFQCEGILKKYFLRKGENHYIDEQLLALIFEDI